MCGGSSSSSSNNSASSARDAIDSAISSGRGLDSAFDGSFGFGAGVDWGGGGNDGGRVVDPNFNRDLGPDVGVDDPGLVDNTGLAGGVKGTSTATTEAARRDVDRARAAIDDGLQGYQNYDPQSFLGSPYTTNTEKLGLNKASINPSMVEASSTARFTDEETFTEAIGRKVSNPMETSAIGAAGSVLSLATGFPALGIAGEVIDAAINRDQVNLTGPGGRYNWSPTAHMRGVPATPGDDSSSMINPIAPASPKTTTAEMTAAVSNTMPQASPAQRTRRTQNSTIATSIFGDTSYANIIRSRLGGR